MTPGAEVERQVVRSLAAWPLEAAVPVLLDALARDAVSVRKLAAEQLAARWPGPSPVAFPCEAPPVRRAEALAELRTRYQRSTALVVPASAGMSKQRRLKSVLRAHGDEHVEQLLVAGDFAALAAIGPDVVAALERLAIDRGLTLPEPVYRDVLPRYSPAFAALEDCAGKGDSPALAATPLDPQAGSSAPETTTALGDFNQRRHAAEDFAAATKIHPPGRLATARLCALITTETDPVVWTRALEAIENETSEPAARVARLALSQNAGEVRRKACEFLAAHPDAANETFLLPLLNDHEQTVVLAAIRRFGCGRQNDEYRRPQERIGCAGRRRAIGCGNSPSAAASRQRERATMPSGV